MAIHIKYPVSECNKTQEDSVNAASEETKRFTELFFTIGNATYIYHNSAADFEPGEADYLKWLEGLSRNIRKHMQE